MEKSWRYGLTFNIGVLAAASLLTDVSSEMIVPLLPFFIVSLGGTAAAIGLIEGIAESVVSFVRIFSGHRSDAIGRRKPFVAAGYGTSTAAKVILAVASWWPHVLVARAGDRLGKGVRDPPRDALLADSTPAETRGKAFGFHRSMDTTGAIVGPILAAVLIVLGLTYNQIFLVAAIPAAVASLVVLLVREKRGVPMRRPLLASLSDLPPAVRRYFAVAALFAFGQVTMSLFLLRAGELSGLNPTAMISGVIALYVAFNVVYALLAFEVGRISDRVGRRPMLIAGYLTFAAAAAGFGLLPDPVFLLPLFLVLGASYAFVDGSQRAMVVDLTPADRRGTSLGAYHALIGAAKLPSGILAGVLYASVGPLAAFGLGGVLATLAAVSFVLVLRPTVSK